MSCCAARDAAAPARHSLLLPLLLPLLLAACGTTPPYKSDTHGATAPAAVAKPGSAAASPAGDANTAGGTVRPMAPAAESAAVRPPATSPEPTSPSTQTPRIAPSARPRPIERPAIERPPPAAVERSQPTPMPVPADDIETLAAAHGFVPVPNAIPDSSRFARLRLGMTKQDAEALLGRPQHALHYANEGARIPFYAGDDSSRWETFYRGQGRLMFSGAWLTGEVRLIYIEYNPNEDGHP